MQVGPVSSLPVPSTNGKQMGQLGKEDFLKLLLAQLRNQDPLKPMEDTQFIAQLAQFSTLERIQEMDERIAFLLEVEQLGQANGLIGKVVEALDGNSGEKVKGVVDLAKMVDGSAVLQVGGKAVKLRAVLTVEPGDQWSLAQASSLIGKEVAAQTADRGLVKGTVDSVKVADGSVLLLIADRAVRLREVTSMAEGGGAQFGQASSFIGKEVEARVGLSGDPVTGVVQEAEMVDGKVVLKVGSRSIKLSEVISLAKGPDPTP